MPRRFRQPRDQVHPHLHGSGWSSIGQDLEGDSEGASPARTAVISSKATWVMGRPRLASSSMRTDRRHQRIAVQRLDRRAIWASSANSGRNEAPGTAAPACHRRRWHSASLPGHAPGGHGARAGRAPKTESTVTWTDAAMARGSRLIDVLQWVHIPLCPVPRHEFHSKSAMRHLVHEGLKGNGYR